MPIPVKILYEAVTALNRSIFLMASLLMFVIVPVMLFAVVSRYVFNSPSSWAMELATLVFGPYFLLAGPHLLHERGHVSLDLVQHAVGPKVRRILEIINYPIIIAFCVILLFYAVPFARQALEYGETSYSSWNPPIWPIKLFVPLALVLLGLQATVEWLRLIFDPCALTEDHPDHGIAS
ncbi:TRAP transporter small permease subunit [Pseudorhizobium marinum]|uniref:TRAP transporter small permease protein n=2 Tax=Pseudorhizobium pelagicum TaxID=1509405 RepID=A0A922T5B1_9HYPH|nr:TRAP transporter small permease subunit [Pseudorhizobium marinum]KEQ03264.1 C4-dicarboxylate ABC transporter substrate-binding protein [Pseudorhizobium pelagicum]KEQ05167.1 C4-dicarboxylate ABC transporter substrate-binding protein [Pseudorhizobium pelagicum]